MGEAALVPTGSHAGGGLMALTRIRPAEVRISCAECIPGNPYQHPVHSEKIEFSYSRPL